VCSSSARKKIKIDELSDTLGDFFCFIFGANFEILSLKINGFFGFKLMMQNNCMVSKRCRNRICMVLRKNEQKVNFH